jgi:hypothetical protein
MYVSNALSIFFHQSGGDYRLCHHFLLGFAGAWMIGGEVMILSGFAPLLSREN